MEWKDIKEEQPEEEQIVWALEEEHQGAIMVKYIYIQDDDNSGWAFAKVYNVPDYVDGKWIGDSDFDDEYKVTHWMALPEREPKMKEVLIDFLVKLDKSPYANYVTKEEVVDWYLKGEL